MITYTLTQLTRPTGLQHVLDAFPNKAHEAVTALDYSFGLHGLTRCSHSILLYILANQYNHTGAKIVEVGAYKGHTTCMLSRACPLGTVYAVEPLYADVIKDSLVEPDAYGFANPYKNIQVMQAYSMDAITQFADNSLDFVFIDGDHDKAVMQDMAWYDKLGVGGLIMLHDWHVLYPYVLQAVDSLGKRIGKTRPDIEFSLDGGLAGWYK